MDTSRPKTKATAKDMTDKQAIGACLEIGLKCLVLSYEVQLQSLEKRKQLSRLGNGAFPDKGTVVLTLQ